MSLQLETYLLSLFGFSSNLITGSRCDAQRYLNNLDSCNELKKMSLKRIKWRSPFNSTHSNYSRFQISALINNFDFLKKNYQKRTPPFKNRKSEHHHWILHIWVRLSTKFQLKMTIFNFWTKLAQKRYFQYKIDAANITIEFCKFELVWVSNLNFTLNQQFWVYGSNTPKKGT